MNGLELARLKNAYEGGPSPDSSAIRLPLTDEITQTLLINYEVTPDRCHTTPGGLPRGLGLRWLGLRPGSRKKRSPPHWSVGTSQGGAFTSHNRPSLSSELQVFVFMSVVSYTFRSYSVLNSSCPIFTAISPRRAPSSVMTSRT